MGIANCTFNTLLPPSSRHTKWVGDFLPGSVAALDLRNQNRHDQNPKMADSWLPTGMQEKYVTSQEISSSSAWIRTTSSTRSRKMRKQEKYVRRRWRTMREIAQEVGSSTSRRRE